LGLSKARLNAASSGGESVHFSHDDRYDISMMEHEADKMSMDDSASASCSEAPEDDVAMNDDPEDVTDDEDWAAVGAAALRADSYPNMAAVVESGLSSNTYTGGMRTLPTNFGGVAHPHQVNIDYSAFPATSDAQEREAVEALLRLGSV
jgi:hypothetical protein